MKLKYFIHFTGPLHSNYMAEYFRSFIINQKLIVPSQKTSHVPWKLKPTLHAKSFPLSLKLGRVIPNFAEDRIEQKTE